MRKGKFIRRTSISVEGGDLQDLEKCEVEKYTIIEIFRRGLKETINDIVFSEERGK